jgi:hypothetical protein
MEIPEPVLEQVYLIRKTHDYLQNKARYWEENKAKWNKETGNPLIPILSVLLKRNEFQLFGELVEHLQKTWQEKDLSEGYSTFFSEIGLESMREPILSKLQDRQIPNRKELFTILENLAHFFYQSLIPLCADEDILLRRNICRILVCAGPSIIPDLLIYGKDPVRNWQVIRNVVMVLGELGSSAELVMTFLKRCHRHPNPRVREEVNISFGKIKGPEAEKILIRDLDHPDKTHLAPVILSLGNFDPVHPNTVSFIQETLRKKRKNETEADSALQVNCCLAIESIARFNLSAVQSFGPILCDAIAPEKPSLFGIIREKHHEKVYEVKKAICQLLGEIGTKEAFPLVGRLITEKYWHPEDNAAIHLALQKIERRINSG